MDPAKRKFPPGITIRNHLKAGDSDHIASLHGTLYGRESGWDKTFESYVAVPLGKFARSHSPREKIWIVEKDGEIAGSVAIVEASGEKAQLRWLLLAPGLRGRGIGRMLVEEALSFCRESAYSSVFLWTEKSLEAAARLYRLFRFRLTEEKTHELWGAVVTEQRYDLQLK